MRASRSPLPRGACTTPSLTSRQRPSGPLTFVTHAEACGACGRAARPSRARSLDAWKDAAIAPGGADVRAFAVRRGWVARLDRDLSGAAHVEIQGERATVVTARGTRYPFRRRENGIWGLTIFTAELQAEAERASRDLDGVDRAAGDYDRAKPP